MSALAKIKKEWSSITDAARDRLVIESVVGRDSWKVTPALPALKALLRLGANPNARVASDRDHYPIRAKTSALELCTWELEHPEHVDLVLSKKEVARRNAVLVAAATALVDAGASVGSYANKREDSPLHQAANAAARELVRVLLAKGADPNRKNRDGETPLFAAARANDVASIELLLARGARNLRNRKNDRAADVAFAAAAFDAYSLLRETFREPDLESRFDGVVLSAEDGRRLLARRRASSFTAIAVSGEADPAGLRAIASFKLRGNALEAAIRARAIARLPQAVRSRLLEAIGEEAHRLASGAKIDIGSYSIGGAVPRFFPRSGLARAREFAASYRRADGGASSRAAAAPAVPAAGRARRASPLQPDHMVQRTEALLPARQPPRRARPCPWGDRRSSGDEPEGVVFGCDMSQELHRKGVRGERVAASYRWQVRPADLSSRAGRARTRRCPGGTYYLIAGYY